MICEQCLEEYKLSKSKVWWDENGVWSIKFSTCPYCNKNNVVKTELYFEEDVNNDIRYYMYKK